MFKMMLRDPDRFAWCNQHPILSRFTEFELDHLPFVHDEITFARVMQTLRLANGSYKTTRERRFEELDEFLVGLLKAGRSYKIHDVAASDGLTSAELVGRLAAAGICFDFLLSDKYVRIFAARRFGCVRYTDHEGARLRTSIFGLLADAGQPWTFALSRLLGILSDRLTFFDRTERRELQLLSPAIIRLMQKHNVRFIDFDIFDGFNGVTCIDIVRCMNILNPRYFSGAELRSAIMIILEPLRDGGLFLVGRTDIQTGLNHATLYQRSGASLVPVQRFNRGAEIERLIDSVVPW